ncbi:hypothetical protein [Thiomonas sp.]|uniref:hypothetical protein n=1 Tax=Thiomonas sp. TaxID=2047785 RepID=UPI002608963A|nr:hypothetical protein [Thiomonas sp.]
MQKRLALSALGWGASLSAAFSNLAEQSKREGWPAEGFLGAPLEHEIAERETRRLQRNRVDSQLFIGTCSS